MNQSIIILLFLILIFVGYIIFSRKYCEHMDNTTSQNIDYVKWALANKIANRFDDQMRYKDYLDMLIYINNFSEEMTKRYNYEYFKKLKMTNQLNIDEVITKMTDV